MSCLAIALASVGPVTSEPKYHMWPPMIEIGRPQSTMRGPISRPSRTASRSLNMVTFLGPFSRTDVTPDSSDLRTLRADCRVSTSSGSSATSSPGRPSPKPLLCVWQSTMPGITVLGPKSRTSTGAPSGAATSAWRPTARIRPPSTSTAALSRGRPPAPSSSRAALISVNAPGSLVVTAGVPK